MGAHTEIRLTGSGGQGLILIGIILAEAAVKEWNSVVQSQSYGPEARGGSSKAEVIMSEDTIDYPKVTQADILLAMNQESCNTYMPGLRNGGIAILDQTFVPSVPQMASIDIYQIPITQLARQRIGKELVANIVALGVLVGLTEVVSRQAVQEAVLARVPKGTEALNIQALELGFQAAEEAQKNTLANNS